MTTVIGRWHHSVETIFETWTVGTSFPCASTQRARCRTLACLETLCSWGILEFSTGRRKMESFKSLVHTSLCSQHGIFLIMALAVSTKLLFLICSTGGLFYLTCKSKINKESNCQNKKQGSCSGCMDTSCYLPLKGAFLPYLTLSWQVAIHLFFDQLSNVLRPPAQSHNLRASFLTWGPSSCWWLGLGCRFTAVDISQSFLHTKAAS